MKKRLERVFLWFVVIAINFAIGFTMVSAFLSVK